MRGDSRLDLYAKSLALIGLGFVGTVGALIDYWPGPVRVPHVVAANVRRADPVVRTLVDMRGLESAPAVLLVASSITAVDVQRVAVGEAPEPSMTGGAPVEGLEATAVAGTTDGAPPVAEALLPSSSPGSSLPPVTLASAVESDAPDTFLDDSRTFVPWQPMLSPVAVDRSEDGFFSGMLKKTSSSVTSSIGKASNSVVGAVRAVGGAVRKAF